MSTDEAAEAAGKLGEALEYVERARGYLYNFHHHIGHADLMLDDVIEGLEKGGHSDLVEMIRTQVYGRDVIEDRWTYQVVDEFDDGYYAAWRAGDRGRAGEGARRRSPRARGRSQEAPRSVVGQWVPSTRRRAGARPFGC